jgi:hypothetical protein
MAAAAGGRRQRHARTSQFGEFGRAVVPTRQLGMSTLTAAQVEEFETTGVLCGIQAVPPPVAAANRAAFDERAAAEGGALPHYLSMHTEDKWAWDLVTSPSIVNAAAQLLGTDNVFMLATHAFCKLPETTGFVGWHQVRPPPPSRLHWFCLKCGVINCSLLHDAGPYVLGAWR